jgi:hypothetical protein
MAHAAAVLSELQNRAPPVPDLVPSRSLWEIGCLQMLNLCPNRSNAFAMSMVTGRRTVAPRLVPGRGRPREKGPRRAAAAVRLCSIRQEEAGPANPWPTRRKGHDALREYCRRHAELDMAKQSSVPHVQARWLGRALIDAQIESAFGLRVQSISATPLAVYRPAFRSPRSFADVD